MKITDLACKNREDGQPRSALNRLHEVKLNGRYRRMYERAVGGCGGPIPWQARKRAEAHNLLALAQISGRLDVKEIDLRESFRAVCVLETPVMLQPDHSGNIKLAGAAILGLVYRQEAVSTPQPGTSFVCVLAPEKLWYSNVGPPEKGQPLCLGLTIQAAIPIKEIVLMTWGLLSMQTVMIDEQDSAGVLNAAAAKWWQQNLDRIPLTTDPFIRRNNSTKGCA
jgi:hypothetical protein